MSIILPSLCMKILNAFAESEVYSEYIEKSKVNKLLDKDKLYEIYKMMEKGKAYFVKQELF